MKKIIAAILAVCMMLTIFVGCGNHEQPNETTVHKETTVP